MQVATPMVASSEAAVEKEGAPEGRSGSSDGPFPPSPPGAESERDGAPRFLWGRRGAPLWEPPPPLVQWEEKAKSSWFGLRSQGTIPETQVCPWQDQLWSPGKMLGCLQ